MTNPNIYTVFDHMIPRNEKESLLKQRSIMIWFTGLSGSGKSTLALALEDKLHRMGYFCSVLDGDNIRFGINKNLSFTVDDRVENIRRIAEIGKLFINVGVITIAAFISPTESIRNIAKDIIGERDFVEIYVSTPIEVCEDRDIKGLYKKARMGLISDFTGVSQQFEAPKSPACIIDTSIVDIDTAIDNIMSVIAHRIAM